MSDRLVVRLSPDGDLCWLRQADGRAPMASQRGAPPSDVLAAAGEIVVLVPAADVLLTEAVLSARNRAQLLQALPYAIEDQLLSPVEELHFGVGQARDGRVGVAVVARERMREWLSWLGAAGIAADVMLPESLALPVDDGHVGALIEDDGALLRLAPWSAVACAPAELPQWLEQLQDAEREPPALDVDDFRDAPPLVLPWPIARYRQPPTDPLALLTRGIAASPLNLLDGEFAPRHRRARGDLWWRRAAMLAAAAVVLAVLHAGVEVMQLSRSAARLDTAMRDVVREAFPDLSPNELVRISPEPFVRQRIESLRGGGQSDGLLPLLARIAPVLGGTTRIQTRGMEYRNGTLELGLRTPDVAVLDDMRERFAAQPGLVVEVTAATPGDAGIDGRIRISAVTP